MPFDIPVLAWVFLILIIPVALWGVARKNYDDAVKAGKIVERRRMIIASMTHYVDNNMVAYADFKKLFLDFPKCQDEVYLNCNKNTIDVYRSFDSALKMADGDTHSILRVTMVAAPDWSVRIEQLSEHETGVHTQLGFGITTV